MADGRSEPPRQIQQAPQVGILTGRSHQETRGARQELQETWSVQWYPW